MGFTDGKNDTAMTPGRSTWLRMDVSESAMAVTPYSLYRNQWGVARGGIDPHTSPDVIQIGTGAWCLKAYNMNGPQVSERSDRGAAGQLRLAHFSTPAGVVEVPRWRYPSDLAGMPALPAGVAASGDYYLQKSIGASGTFAATMAADIAAYGQVVPPSNTRPLDRVAVGNIDLPQEQAIEFGFDASGQSGHHPDILKVVYLGSATNTDGTGAYAVAYLADGRCQLWQMNGADPPTQVDEWGYTQPTRAGGTPTVMRITPHRTFTGAGFMLFESGVNYSTLGSTTFNGGFANAASATQHVYVTPPNRSGGTSPARVTGHGPLRVDTPRDHRIPFKVARHIYPPTGVLTDNPMTLPWHTSGSNSDTAATITLQWQSVIPGGCGLVGKLYSNDTKAELPSLISTTISTKVYRWPPGGISGVYAVFEFSSSPDGLSTPFLWGYKVLHNGYLAQQGMTEIPTRVRAISVTGPEKDTTHETASCEVKDVTGSLSLLATRAMIAAQMETQYDPDHPHLRSCLIRGYITRAEGRDRGTVSTKAVGGGSQYPSADWVDYSLQIAGIHERLKRTLTFFRLPLIDDSGDGGTVTAAQGFRVTDVIKALLGYAGFEPSRIDVPASPIRFYASATGGEDLILDPLSNVIDTVQHMAAEYLGWYLIYDGNIGPADPLTGEPMGMIRLRKPNVPAVPWDVTTYNILARFTTKGPGAGKLAHKSQSYAPPTDQFHYVSRGGKVIAPILKEPGGKRSSWVSWVRPPEANAVIVTGSGALLQNKDGEAKVAQWAVNPQSYNAFVASDGSSVATADLGSPDFLNFISPVVRFDTNLSNQQTVDIFTRRIYDVACHGVKCAKFDAPLVLVNDADDHLPLADKRPRPLRYYDAIEIERKGTVEVWLIRNCNPYYTKDDHQFAHYEIEKAYNR